MIRPIATEIGLFLTPFLLYAAFLWATRAGVMDRAQWPLTRVITLAIVAMLLMLGSFLFFANYGSAPVGQEYVPAHVEDGKLVPGRLR